MTTGRSSTPRVGSVAWNHGAQTIVEGAGLTSNEGRMRVELACGEWVPGQGGKGESDVRIRGWVGVLAAAACVGVIAGCQEKWVPYVPMAKDSKSGELVKDPSLLTSRHELAFRAVLARQGDPCMLRNGVVYVPRELEQDEEWLWNYTTRAEELSDAELEQFRAFCLGP